MKQQPWHAAYTQGVPYEIDLNKYASLIELLDRSFAKNPDRYAFINMGFGLRYKEIDRLSAKFASFLLNHAKLKPGDRVAIQMPNLLQYPIAMFGALRAGMIVVNTNPLYTPREMEHQFKDSGAKVLVILANYAANLEKIIQHTPIETVVVTEIGDCFPPLKRFVTNLVVKHIKKMVPAYDLPSAVSFNDALNLGREGKFQKASVKPDDTAFIQYTGGTTGVSKGAELSHRNLLSNMEMMFQWMSHLMREGEEVVITALPLYHIFSLTVNCFTFTAYGGTNVLITNPRDMPGFVKELKKTRFTAFSGVNTLFNGLLNTPGFNEVDFSHLKLTVGGGMAVQKAVAAKWKEVTGCPLCEGYGLTESSPVLSANPLDGREIIGSIGLPMPSTEIKIMKEDGTEAAQGEEGEVWGRGPQIMKGYFNRPDETEKTLTQDGWLRTGDIGLMMENGFFRLVDRLKDMILVSGFNVYPNEIEDVVASHPKVLEVAAIGIPDEKSNEAVKIFVVKKDESLTAEELKEHCKQNLTGYKLPKVIEFRKELPKTNVGKILRRALKEETAK